MFVTTNITCWWRILRENSVININKSWPISHQHLDLTDITVTVDIVDKGTSFYSVIFFRKIVLVDVHVRITLVLKRQPLQMSRLQRLPPRHQQSLPSWYWVQWMPTTCLWSLISMVSWFFYVWIILSLGNINENLSFEYGDDARADSGCGATLNGEFWYFGNDKQVSNRFDSRKFQAFLPQIIYF